MLACKISMILWQCLRGTSPALQTDIAKRKYYLDNTSESLAKITSQALLTLQHFVNM